MAKITNLGGVVITIMILCVCSDGLAQEDAGDATDAGEDAFEQEKKMKQREIDLLDLDKQIADKKRELAKAEAPDTETGGKTGSVEFKSDLNKAGYFAEIIAYETLNEAADEISAAVSTKTTNIDTPKIVLTTEMATAEHAALWSLLDIKMADFEKAFVDLYQRHDPGVMKTADFVPTLPLYLGGLVDIANFFKVNQEIYGREVNLSNNALVAEVANRVLALSTKEKPYEVIVPSISLEGKGKLFATLSTLVTMRNESLTTLEKVKKTNKEAIDKHKSLTAEISKAKTELAKLKAANPKDPEKIKKVEAQIEKKEKEREKYEEGNQRWVDASREIGQAKSAFDAFYSLITTPPEKGKKSQMEVIAPIDVMKELQDEGLFVVLDIVSKGGEVNVTTSAWSGGRVNYIGGSVSVYFITKGDGQILGAGSSIKYGTGAYRSRGGVKTLDVDLIETNQ